MLYEVITECKQVDFSCGNLTTDYPQETTKEANGTYIEFLPDAEIFGKFTFQDEYIETLLRNYSYLNTGLTINYNGTAFQSKNGLLDLLTENMTSPQLYPIIHLFGEDVEIALTHGNQYGEEYYTFVNGQHTTQGGTHLLAFREAIVKTVRDYYSKNFDVLDIRSGLIAAVSIKVEEPVFESQTKTKLGSKDMGPNGPSVRNFLFDFITQKLDNYLHKNAEASDAMLRKIIDSEKERKAISGIHRITSYNVCYTKLLRTKRMVSH